MALGTSWVTRKGVKNSLWGANVNKKLRYMPRSLHRQRLVYLAQLANYQNTAGDPPETRRRYAPGSLTTEAALMLFRHQTF